MYVSFSTVELEIILSLLLLYISKHSGLYLLNTSTHWSRVIVNYIPGGPKKWHPFQLRQYNATYKLPNSSCLCNLKKNQHLLLIIHILNVFNSFIWKPCHNACGTQSFTTRRLWIKQRSSLVNPSIVTKLQVIRLKQNSFTKFGRQRTTPFNEHMTCE